VLCCFVGLLTELSEALAVWRWEDVIGSRRRLMVEPLSKKIRISIPEQCLVLLSVDSGQTLSEYPVSTAENGPGEREGSGCTPVGRHYIRAKIGRGVPEGAVFVGRRWTGEIYSAALADQYPERDWILSRILWLCGLESGKNRGGQCDTMRRFIYLHGTPDTEPMGVPRSHGCVRMRNNHIIELYNQVAAYTPVEILL
jgi:lipoprotein-anchoring transpeptidase ErfK/SrfK